MDDLLRQIMIVVFSYLAVFFFSIIIIGFMQRGFFWSFIRAKMSGGKKLIVKIRSITRPIYKIGRIQEGDLMFKNSDKKDVRFKVDKDDIYRDMGVFFVEVDDEKGIVIRPNLVGVTGFDPEKMNSLYLRCLYRPTLLDQKAQIMLILLIILTLMVLMGLFFSYQTSKKVELTLQTATFIKRLLLQNASSMNIIP
jgi:hypothetical protein